jgi:hypothetical protein
MFSVEWSCLESVTHRGSFRHSVHEFIVIVTSVGGARCTPRRVRMPLVTSAHLMLTLGTCRVVARGYVNGRVIVLYLAHAGDSGVRILPLNAIPKTLEEV